MALRSSVISSIMRAVGLAFVGHRASDFESSTMSLRRHDRDGRAAQGEFRYEDGHLRAEEAAHSGVS